MSLPFADKPDQSSIYQDLKTVTLQDLTPEQFDSFRARMLSQGTDGLEDEYRRLKLLGEAAGASSSSGPLRNSIKIVPVPLIASGSAAYYDFGEGVYTVSNIVAIYSGGSGTINWRLYYYDTVNPPIEILYAAGTSTTLFNFNLDAQFYSTSGPQFYGDGVQIGIRYDGSITGDVNAYLIYHRLR